MPRLDSQDEGKRIVTPDGTVVGSVELVHRSHAYARPKPGLMQGWMSWIAGPDCELDLFPIDTGRIERVESDRVVLKAEERSVLSIESRE